eukprot:scpid67973/ scgid11145/ 
MWQSFATSSRHIREMERIKIALLVVCCLCFVSSREANKKVAKQKVRDGPQQFDDDTPPFFKSLQTVKVTSDLSVEWTQFGPGMSGNSDRGYWHPTDPNWTYQGPNMYNAYYSSNRGTTYWGILDWDAPQNVTDTGPIELKAVAFSYQDENFGFCSSDRSQGLWATNDKGRTWTYHYELDPVWNSSHINCMQADPTNDSIWYAGAGDATYIDNFVYTHDHPHGVYAHRNTVNASSEVPMAADQYTNEDPAPVMNGSTNCIWRSMDKGVTWSKLKDTNIPQDANIVRIVVNPLMPSHVFAATTYGLYKSIDHGDTWTLLHVDNDIVRDMDIRVDKINKKFEIYVLTLTMWEADGAGGVASKTGGIFKSVDEGVTWQSLVGDMHINMSLLATDYQVKWYYYQFLGIWFSISIDEAMKTYPNIPEHFLDGLVRVRVDPNNASRIYVMNDYKSQVSTMPVVMWCTHNGGVHWD